jgi:hypothetical protein
MLIKKEGDPGSENWDAFGVHRAQVVGWKMLGFDSFEAAMAQGDGFTPAFAADYRRQLRATAGRWRRVGLDSVDGLLAPGGIRRQGSDTVASTGCRCGSRKRAARRLWPNGVRLGARTLGPVPCYGRGAILPGSAG